VFRGSLNRQSDSRAAQEIYLREGVEWKQIDYQDNTPVLELIAKWPTCLMGMLDDACKTGAGTDEKVLGSFHETFASSASRVTAKVKAGYVKPKLGADRTFGVVHYAGKVTYQCMHFVEMNRDETSAEIGALLETDTGFTKLAELAAIDAAQKQAQLRGSSSGRISRSNSGSSKDAKRSVTVSRAFSRQLDELAARLRATTKQCAFCLEPSHLLRAAHNTDVDMLLTAPGLSSHRADMFAV
jgi:myosin heavy subunit